MHSENFTRKPAFPFGDQVSHQVQNAHTSSVFNGFVPFGSEPRIPLGNVDFHPSVTCPRNFIIFDQTISRSQIMFHPEISSKLFDPGFSINTPIIQSNVDQVPVTNDGKMDSSFKEDSDDINALLSTECGENSECDDDDEVSTARTHAIYECNSPESCSNYQSPPRKSRSLFRKSSWSSGDDKRRLRMRKMVKALRKIVPGANRMSAVAVLDEAVHYLKSLRVEVQKLGVGTSRV